MMNYVDRWESEYQYPHVKISQALAMCQIAGIKVNNIIPIQNQYWWPTNAGCPPFWLMKTSIGEITIGHRKRVIAISWETTGHKVIVTEDNVTKSETMVHAWTTLKACEYLTKLREFAETASD